MENNDLYRKKNTYKRLDRIQKVALYLFIGVIVVYLFLSFKFLMS